MNTEVPFSFTIVNENLYENDEIVRLQGSVLLPATFIGEALVNITNDDCK